MFYNPVEKSKPFASSSQAPVYKVDYVEGSFLLTPASAWRQLGGIDERNYMYGDDVEYCRSLLNLGLITVHCPSLRYTHFGGYNHSRMAFLFADARRFLPAFDIFVLLSTQPDPFPTVVLEAMGAGVPVIATAHGGPLEMITHQETGILVTPSDAEEPAAAISGLASDPSLRHAIGEAGRERFHQCFGLEPYLGQIQQIYSKVLENE